MDAYFTLLYSLCKRQRVGSLRLLASVIASLNNFLRRLTWLACFELLADVVCCLPTVHSLIPVPVLHVLGVFFHMRNTIVSNLQLYLDQLFEKPKTLST